MTMNNSTSTSNTGDMMNSLQELRKLIDAK